MELWYSSIGLSTLLLDEETTISDLLKFEGKPMRMRKILGSRWRRTKDERKHF